MTDPDPSVALPPQALEDAEFHKALLDQVEIGIYMVDVHRRIRYWNFGAEQITGYLRHEVAGRLCSADLLMHCDLDGGVLCGTGCPLAAVIADGNPRESTVFLRHKHGHRVPVHIRARAIHDAAGAIVGAVEIFEEAVSHGRSELPSLAPYGCIDKLTGAMTRPYGELRFRQALEELDQFGVPFGWLRAGVDGPERIEHRWGHGAMEAAVELVAHTLDRNVGSRDTLIRWDSRELRIAVRNCLPSQLRQLARKLVMLVRCSNFVWWGDPQRVSISIGGAMGETGDSLDSIEKRVAGPFESSRTAGGDRASIAGYTKNPDEFQIL